MLGESRHEKQHDHPAHFGRDHKQLAIDLLLNARPFP